MDKLPWWNNEQIKFADEVEDFIDNEILPVAIKMDPEEQRKIQWNISKYIADKGYSPLKILVGDEYGGPNVGYTGYCILLEELGRTFLNLSPLMTSVFVGWPIYLYGSSEQKEKYLEPLIKGEAWGATVVTEPDAGSDVAAIQMRAEKDGDYYVLNGWKRFITLGRSADLFMVYCLTDTSKEAKKAHMHLSAFIVPRKTRGIKVKKVVDLYEAPELDVCILEFDDVRVPAENLILEEGAGWTVLTSAVNIERLGIAGTVGQAKIVIETCKAYARRRVQFGEPIMNFQLIQQRIADMITKYSLTRIYLYYLAHMLDLGKVDMFKFGVEASMLKIFATEALIDICDHASMILGGDGRTKEFGLGNIFSNAYIMRIGGGSNDILRLFIGRTELMKKIDKRFLPAVLRGVKLEEFKRKSSSQ